MRAASSAWVGLHQPSACRDPPAPPTDASVRAHIALGYFRDLVTGTASYAVVAHPIKAGQSGVRSFCADHTGRICFDPSDRADLVEYTGTEVSCLRTCETLE